MENKYSIAIEDSVIPISEATKEQMHKFIVNDCIDNQEIIDLAKEKLKIDLAITKIIQEENPNFSYKKLVGDLGEYYAKKNIECFFDELKFSEKRVSVCDLIGTLKDEYSQKWNLPKLVNIEVKTRYFQQGSQHIGNVHKDNFHLLVFVSLYEDYSIHYLSMVKNTPNLKISSNGKIIYNKNIIPLFATNEDFIPHKYMIK